MEPDISARLDAMEKKIDAILVAANKTRRSALWNLIITIAVIVLPAILLAFAVPAFLSSYVGGIQNASNLIQ